MRDVIYRDFSGGLNTTDSPMLLPPNELQRCDNFLIDRNGRLYTRRGCYYISTIDTTDAIGLFRYYYGGVSRRTLVWKGTDVHANTNDGAEFSVIKDVASAGYHAWFTALRNHAFFCSDGAIVGYNGSATISMFLTDINKPILNLLVDAPAVDTNKLRGYYAWALTQYDNLGESASPETYCVTSGADYYYRAELGQITASAGVSGLRVWRATIVGAMTGAYRLVDVVTNTLINTYVDNVPDFLLGEEWLPSEGATAFDASHLTTFDSRLFCVESDDGYTLRWSKRDVPKSWPKVNQITVGRGDGRKITAVCALSGRLIIFKSDSIWVLYGDFDETDPNYSLALVSDKVGTRHPHSVVKDGDVIYFLADDGVWRYDGELRYVSTKIRKTFLDRISDTKDILASAVVYKRELWLSFAEAGGANDVTYVLSLDALDAGRECWTRHTFGVKVFAKCDGLPDVAHTGNFYGLIAARGNPDAIYRLDTGQSDGGTKIDSVFKTAPLDAGTPNQRKRFRKVRTWLRMYTGYPMMTAEADFAAQTDWQLLPDPVGDRFTAYKVVLDAKMKGHTLTVSLHHNMSGGSCEVGAVEIELEERPRR